MRSVSGFSQLEEPSGTAYIWKDWKHNCGHITEGVITSFCSLGCFLCLGMHNIPMALVLVGGCYVLFCSFYFVLFLTLSRKCSWIGILITSLVKFSDNTEH